MDLGLFESILTGKLFPVCLKVFKIKTSKGSFPCTFLSGATGWRERIMYEDWCTLLTRWCVFQPGRLLPKGSMAGQDTMRNQTLTNISRRVINTSANCHSLSTHCPQPPCPDQYAHQWQMVKGSLSAQVILSSMVQQGLGVLCHSTVFRKQSSH